jgi:hypothetical protein
VCPLCGAPGLAYRYSVCAPCWDLVPWRLQEELLGAWRRRVRDPVAHREALVALLNWAREHRVVTGDGD